jgi:hypothetical protein
MAWDIHESMRPDARWVAVRARWNALGDITDVSLDCGPGVHSIGVEDQVRREMSAFSRPLRGVFSWDHGVQEPTVFLTWCDAGETCEQVIRLAHEAPDVHHSSRHPSTRLRALLHAHSVTTTSSGSASHEPEARRE